MPIIGTTSGGVRCLIHILSTLVALSFSCSADRDSRHSKKVFKYNQPDGLTSLDPAFARSQANIWGVAPLFNGLVELDESMRVQPCLARSWTVSSDGVVYTFYLETNVGFHDNPCFAKGIGRNMTADDFVYSFNRVIAGETGSPGAWIFNDKVLRDTNGAVSDTCFLAKNDSTLVIYLQKPFPAFPEILAMPYCHVVPKEAIAYYGKEFRINPVGTGPFGFKHWEEGQDLVYWRNKRYWRYDDSGTRLPYLDAILVTFLNDKNQAYLTFEQGKIDFVSDLNENSRELLFNFDGSLKEEHTGRFQIIKGPYLNTEYLGFQLDSGFYTDHGHPLLNREIRRALSLAIDRERLIRYILFNKGIPGTSGFVPAALPSFDSAYVHGYGFDQGLAGTLLANAGYPGGKGMPALKLYTTAQYPYKEIAEFLQKQWADIGVSVTIEINPTATIREMIDRGQVHFFRGSWLGDYPDAENYLAVFYSKNFSPEGPNKMHFKNRAFDSLYERALTIQDVEKRYALYREMDKIVMDQAPVIVLFYDEMVRLVNNKVKGLKSNPMNLLNLERVDKEI